MDTNNRLDNHEHRIENLEDGFERHNKFLFGRYNEDTNEWEDGFAAKLADTSEQIASFTTWFKSAAVLTGKSILGVVIPAFLGGAWYVVTHLDKVERALR